MEEPKILVVDDNKDFADVFCDILRSNNYMAESCYGGEEAIQKLQDDPCDIMFLDIRMPQMDGIATLKEIKKIVQNAPGSKADILNAMGVDKDEATTMINSMRSFVNAHKGSGEEDITV